MTVKAIASALTIALSSAGFAEAQIAEAYDAKRCVNLGNDLETPRGVSWGNRSYTRDDLERIKAAGFDTVRLPVRWSDYAGKEAPYTIEPEFLERVTVLVDAALALDLNVVLNIHHYEEIMDDPRGHARRLIELWRQIATHFSEYPDDLWFETLNEPHTNLKGDLMRTLQQASVAAIRETNPDRIVIIMGENWSGIRSLQTNVDAPDANVIYSFHYYDPFDFTHQGAEWLGDDMPTGRRTWGNKNDRDDLKRDADLAGAFAKEKGRPVFLGEFGANDGINNKQRVKWVGAVSEAMEDRDIAWCLWSYGNTFRLYTDENGWDGDMLKALGLSAP